MGRTDENAAVTRKSLKTLQHIATDKENLTGRPTKSDTKEPKKADTRLKSDGKKKNLKNLTSKGIQAGIDDKIKIEDLTSEAGPSENYWEILAEKRRQALEETLDENQKLHERIEELVKENTLLQQMIEESKSLVDVLTEMVGEQEESGIDLAEASTVSLDDTQDTETKVNSDESEKETTEKK